jgi:hypothetical protein
VDSAGRPEANIEPPAEPAPGIPEGGNYPGCGVIQIISGDLLGLYIGMASSPWEIFDFEEAFG